MAKLETRTAKLTGTNEIGYIVSVVDGPRDLLWRPTAEQALRDGAAHVARHWAQTPDGWKAA